MFFKAILFASIATRDQSLQPLKLSEWGLFSDRDLFCLKSISKFGHITCWRWCLLSAEQLSQQIFERLIVKFVVDFFWNYWTKYSQKSQILKNTCQTLELGNLILNTESWERWKLKPRQSVDRKWAELAENRQQFTVKQISS